MYMCMCIASYLFCECHDQIDAHKIILLDRTVLGCHSLNLVEAFTIMSHFFWPSLTS